MRRRTPRRMRKPGAAEIETARWLRQTATTAERIMWSLLRNRNLRNYKFRRQHPLGPYVADFYCAECRLVIELDGKSHEGREAYDARRTRWLESYGLRVLRFRNEDLDERSQEVLAAIVAACRRGGG